MHSKGMLPSSEEEMAHIRELDVEVGSGDTVWGWAAGRVAQVTVTVTVRYSEWLQRGEREGVHGKTMLR